jgi:hypothetical protein
LSDSNEASYKEGHCDDMKQSMICVAANGEVRQKTEKEKLLEPNAENIKNVSFPVLYSCQAVTNLYCSILALSTAEASIQKMS